MDWEALIIQFFLDGVSLNVVVMVKRELCEGAVPTACSGSTMAPTPNEGQMGDNFELTPPQLLDSFASAVTFPSGRCAEEDADMTT